MAGWIKLWRKLIEKGHLKMPNTAFKLWIFCLLKAAPYPDLKQGLAIGELWLSYQSIRENLAEDNKKISNSTISAALKYLQQKGYITLEAEKFKGMKAKIVNWAEYQSFPNHPSAETPAASQKAAAEPSATTTVTAAVFPATPTVTAAEFPATLTVADDYSQRNRTTTPRVAAGAAKPYGGAGSGTAKNYIKNNIKNNNLVVDIASCFETEFGRPLSPIEFNQLVNWQKTFSADLLKEALVCASLHHKHSIAYIGGILKSWQQAGITTAEEARHKHKRTYPKGGKRNARGKPGYRPSEIDWENEPDTL